MLHPGRYVVNMESEILKSWNLEFGTSVSQKNNFFFVIRSKNVKNTLACLDYLFAGSALSGHPV